jgi:hypothetical protein
MRTAALPRVPYLAADDNAADLGLWLRMAVDWEVAFLSMPGVAVRLHGGSWTAALGASLSDDGYRRGIDLKEQDRDVKRRFIDECADRLANVPELRRETERAFRDAYRNRVRDELRSGRGPALRCFVGMVRRCPRVLVEVATYRVVVRLVLGPRRRPPSAAATRVAATSENAGA